MEEPNVVTGTRSLVLSLGVRITTGSVVEIVTVIFPLTLPSVIVPLGE